MPLDTAPTRTYVRRMRLVLLVLAALGACAPAQARCWSTTDTALEATYAAVAIADYVETKVITGDCYEGNPILGECGERVPAEAYFATMIGLHMLVAHLLPGRARTVWQGVTIGVQGRTVVNNYLAIRHGYRFAF